MTAKDHVRITDYESGERVWVTKETYEAMEYLQQRMRGQINPEKRVKGTIIIVSTPYDETGEFKDLWTNNE